MFAKHRKALMLFGTAHLLHGQRAVEPPLANVIPYSAVSRYENNHPGVTFVIDLAPGFGCDTPASPDVAAFRTRMLSWPVPSLVRTEDIVIPNSQPPRTNIDGSLYLGPLDLALAEPRAVDVFLDEEFMIELRRRATFMPKAFNGQVDPQVVREQDANPLLCR